MVLVVLCLFAMHIVKAKKDIIKTALSDNYDPK